MRRVKIPTLQTTPHIHKNDDGVINISQKMICQATFQGYESFIGSHDGWFCDSHNYLQDWTGRDFESVVHHIFAARENGMIERTKYGVDKLTKYGSIIMKEMA